MSPRSWPLKLAGLTTDSSLTALDVERTRRLSRGGFKIAVLLCLLFNEKSCYTTSNPQTYYFLPGCGRTRESPFSFRLRNFSWRLLMVTLSDESSAEACGVVRPRIIGDITEDQSL